MTDLDERDELFDAMLRAAGLRLRDDLAGAAVPRLRKRHRSHRRRWVIAMVAVGAVIIGLVAIGTNRNDQSLGNDPGRLRWLVTDLPDGWKDLSAADPVVGPEEHSFPEFINIYATNAAPLGPVLSVQGSQGVPYMPLTPGAIKGMTTYQEITIEGRRAVFAEYVGTRVLYIEVGGHWVLLRALNIDDSTLSRLALSVKVNSDDSAEIPPTELPDGMRVVAPVGSPHVFLGAPGVGRTVSQYGRPDIGNEMTLVVQRPTVAVNAADALGYQITPIKIGTAVGYVGSSEIDSVPPSTTRVVYWEREGLAFHLTATGVPEADMLAAAASTTPASSSEWDALVRSPEGVATAVTELAGTTPGEVAPASTDPPFTGTPRDVAIDVSVEEVSPNEQVWSGSLPTGETWKVDVTRLYDTMSMWWQINGDAQGGMTGSKVPRDAGTEIFCCPSNVVTADPVGAALRVVRADGERYTVPLHDLPGGDGLRAAFIALPNGGGVQSAELIDGDGNVLQSAP